MKRRSLVILLLATAQLLNWSGPAVYLCLGADGSLAIDMGPANCKSCCHTSHTSCKVTKKCCCSDRQCRANEQARAAAHDDAIALQKHCDCTHIQISRQLGPVVARKTVTPDDSSRLVSTSAFNSCNDAVVAQAGHHAAAYISQLGATSSAPVFLASVVLRC